MAIDSYMYFKDYAAGGGKFLESESQVNLKPGRGDADGTGTAVHQVDAESLLQLL